MAVTIPVVDTVATLAALLDQLTGRPVSGVPVASRAPAVSCCVPPTCKAELAGVTLTEATGAFVTMTTAVALTPSAVAVMVALPGATAVTIPAVETVAILDALLDQKISRPLSEFPPASRSIALNCSVRPIGRITDWGVMAMLAIFLRPRMSSVGAAHAETNAIIAAETILGIENGQDFRHDGINLDIDRDSLFSING
jgi:hypothetical protein